MSAFNHGGLVRHVNGTATTAAAEVQGLGSPSTYMAVQNSGETNTLLVSFDGGATYFTVFPKTALEGPFKIGGAARDAQQKALFVKSGASTTTYEILLVQ